MNDSQIIDKVEGALIGSALGDAIGIYTGLAEIEFMTEEQAKQAYPSRSFSLVHPVTEPHQDTHRCRFETRSWTDDTDHTLLMILSFLRIGSLSQDDFAFRLRTWCQQGLRCLDRLPMGLGKTVGRVVFDPEFLAHPAQAAYAYWDKSGRDIAPNGSLMRTTPVGVICMGKSEEETFKEAIRMGAVTHADPRCAVSVAIVSALVRALCCGEIQSVSQTDSVVERGWKYVLEAHPEVSLDRVEFEKHAYAESLQDLVLCDRVGSALWCLRQVQTEKETFKSAIVKLIMLGGDADTNGAVAGALMGAFCGYDALPAEWKRGMAHEEWYKEKITALCVVAALIEGSYDAQQDTDTELDGGRGLLTEDEMKRREMQIMERMLLTDQKRREVRERETKSQKKPWKFW
ncbi:hypothetical protein HWV62_39158 [Athelia sp. TMB]|nr:hypothetical protein HWV62_39158 [Athelia sp. TMB]